MQHPDLNIEDIINSIEEARNKRGVEWIQLDRTVCFGECPVYSLRIDCHGRVDYHGKMYVDHLGHHQRTIYRGFFLSLVELMELIGFWDFDDHYDEKWKGVTDLSSYVVTANSTLKTKRVESYFDSAPLELWALAGLIDLAFHEAKLLKG